MTFLTRALLLLKQRKAQAYIAVNVDVIHIYLMYGIMYDR